MYNYRMYQIFPVLKFCGHYGIALHLVLLLSLLDYPALSKPNINSPTLSHNDAKFKTGMLTPDHEVLESHISRSLPVEHLSDPASGFSARSLTYAGEGGNFKLRRKQEENSSTDCLSKRSEILRRQVNSPNKEHSSIERNLSPSPQIIRPKVNSNNNQSDKSIDTKAATGSKSQEHIPQCTSSGAYEPIQCMIGFCWCVNKYGLAIKNSAGPLGGKPICDSDMYETDSTDSLVVTGVSQKNLDGLIKTGPITDTSVSNSTGLWDEMSLYDHDGRRLREHELEFNRRVSNSPEPSLALVPNECTMSRDNARNRASRHTDDSIWIPECDLRNEKLYAEKQCHKSKICWCVDQITGLPLRTKEQLSMKPSIDCTSVKTISEVTSSATDTVPLKPNPPVFDGFSEFCNAHMRIEFVLYLVEQFRQQLSEYVKHYPLESPPEEIKETNPQRLDEYQITRWRFATMDFDRDGKLNEYEWSKFKINFKLIDKPEEALYIEHLFNTYSNIPPLNILREQRRCWRDFLKFCGNGDLLNEDVITMSKWLSCTQVPSKYSEKSKTSNNGLDYSYASSKAAAVNRSKKKNPFLGILKPN